MCAIQLKLFSELVIFLVFFVHFLTHRPSHVANTNILRSPCQAWQLRWLKMSRLQRISFGIFWPSSQDPPLKWVSEQVFWGKFLRMRPWPTMTCLLFPMLTLRFPRPCFGMLHSPRKARASCHLWSSDWISKVTIAYNYSILVKRLRENQVIKFSTAEFPISIDVQHLRTSVAQWDRASQRKKTESDSHRLSEGSFVAAIVARQVQINLCCVALCRFDFETQHDNFISFISLSKIIAT